MSSDGLARQNVIVGISITMTVLSVIIVSLRGYTRAVIVRNTGRDDFCMLVALLFTLGYLSTILIMRENGMGYSGKVVSQAQLITTLKTIVGVEILYYLVVNTIKISIVFFYLRIAVETTFERLCKGTIYFITTFCVVCIIVVLTQCVPLHKMWDLTGLVEGQCINSTAFFYMTSSTNIVIDIWILILPIKVLLTIRRPGREKIALIGIFTLGIFSCIASIVRLYSVRVYTESTDPFYDTVPINIWSMVEVHLGIWCASTPALKALGSRKEFERKRMQQVRGGYTFHESGRDMVPGSMRRIMGKEEYVMETVQLESGRIVAATK